MRNNNAQRCQGTTMRVGAEGVRYSRRRSLALPGAERQRSPQEFELRERLHSRQEANHMLATGCFRAGSISPGHLPPNRTTTLCSECRIPNEKGRTSRIKQQGEQVSVARWDQEVD